VRQEGARLIAVHNPAVAIHHIEHAHRDAGILKDGQHWPALMEQANLKLKACVVKMAAQVEDVVLHAAKWQVAVQVGNPDSFGHLFNWAGACLARAGT
jgi:hypothetical protein